MTDLTPEYLSAITDAGFHHAALAIQDLTAENERLKAELAKVKDPNAVHINMLRGDIAKPMWAQIKHIYAEARLAQGEPIAWTFPSANEFARKTRMARGNEGLRAFARRIGISPTTLCRIENGGEPDMKTARAIASTFTCGN